PTQFNTQHHLPSRAASGLEAGAADDQELWWAGVGARDDDGNGVSGVVAAGDQAGWELKELRNRS
ncbi:hypothetical protein HDU96_003963, partial [Phlyctochytrium bullatum]